MANIEVSLSNSSNSPRRRKGTSLGGSTTPSRSLCAENISHSTVKQDQQSALQEREAIIQNLRVQLGLGKLPRPTGAPLNETEIPAAEYELHRLRTDADIKRATIINLKTALESLDITE